MQIKRAKPVAEYVSSACRTATFSTIPGLHVDLSTTIIRPPSRRPLSRCKHNYHTITVTTAFMQM